jgi:hypothetical protein
MLLVIMCRPCASSYLMYVISSFLIIDSIVPKCIIAALVLNFELTSVLLVWGPRPIFGWHTI